MEAVMLGDAAVNYMAVVIGVIVAVIVKYPQLEPPVLLQVVSDVVDADYPTM